MRHSDRRVNVDDLKEEPNPKHPFFFRKNLMGLEGRGIKGHCQGRPRSGLRLVVISALLGNSFLVIAHNQVRDNARRQSLSIAFRSGAIHLGGGCGNLPSSYLMGLKILRTLVCCKSGEIRRSAGWRAVVPLSCYVCRESFFFSCSV